MSEKNAKEEHQAKIEEATTKLANKIVNIWGGASYVRPIVCRKLGDLSFQDSEELIEALNDFHFQKFKVHLVE